MQSSPIRRIVTFAIRVAAAVYIVKPAMFPGLSGKARSTARFQPIKNLARGKDWMVPLQDVPRFEHA